MRFFKTTALAAALTGAAGAGAAVLPVGHAQGVRAVAPRAMQVVTFGAGRIGVTVSDVEATEGKTTAGVRVDSVDEGSPAEKAGLRKGDIVVEFDGERVRSVRQFSRLVSETPPGRTVSAAVLRDGQRTTLNLTPREGGNFRLLEDGFFRHLPTPAPHVQAVPPRPPSPPRTPVPPALEHFTWSFGGNRLGVSIEDLSPQLGEYFGAKDGVLVSSVETDSAAAKAGVKAGDVITSVNGNTVNDGGDLRRRLSSLSAGDEFSLGIVRDKRTMTLKGKLESPQERR